VLIWVWGPKIIDRVISPCVQHWPVRGWCRRNVGRTERCAYQRALKAAHALADKLNAKEAVR
jgi:hypothetical protein